MGRGASMIGRRGERVVLTAALDALDRDSQSVTIHVVGEPGIGKTHLLAVLHSMAEDRHCLVVSGQAAELERDMPFGVFATALDDYLASLDPSRLAVLDAPWVGALSKVFPALAPLAAAQREILSVERYRIYRAVRALLEELGTRRPIVVILDDLQWADSSSAELLTYLTAHPPRAPVMLALSFRGTQIAPRLDRALCTAVREGRAQRLHLGPLTVDEADELIGGIGPTAAVRGELFRDSGGNPFYLQQLMRGTTLAPGEVGQSAEDLPVREVPRPVREALAAELASLSPAAQQFLRSAAVSGDPFEDDLAGEVAGLTEANGLVVLDELLDRELVRPTTVPRRFRFRHPIVRRAVYQSTGAGWRVGAHARAADALKARGTPAPGLAHHVARSARTGDEAAIALLAEAGDAVASQAPAVAARWYKAALRLLPPQDHHEPRRMELLQLMASALSAAGQLEDSHATLMELLNLAHSADSVFRIRLTAACAAVEQLVGRRTAAEARLRQAIEDLADHQSVEAVTLKLELSAAALYASDFTQVRVWAEQALETSRQLNVVPFRVAAAALLAHAEYSEGCTERAVPLLEEAAAFFAHLDDRQLAERLAGAYWLAWIESFMERFDASIEHFQRGISVSRQSGQGQFLVSLMNGQIWAMVCRGRLTEAMAAAAESIEASRLTTQVQPLSIALGLQCLAATYSGDLTTALRVGEEGLELTRGLDPSVFTAGAGLFLAMPLLESGEAKRARAELLSTTGGPDLPLLGRAGRCLAYEILTRADLALGRWETAERWASQAECVCQDGSLAVETAVAQRTRALVLLAIGRADDAAHLALQAADAAAACSPTEAGRCRITAGRALALAGERARAIVELECAIAELTACGAHGYREQAEAELRRLGRRVVRRPQPGPDQGLSSLSERERHIAELVSTGRTNREIAGACHLSEKTIERHLSHIFAKLDVSARAAVAALITRQQGNPDLPTRDHLPPSPHTPY